MAKAILILGESGTGKSTSMRNLDADTTLVINVDGKPLPFRNKLKTVACDNAEQIVMILNEYGPKVKTIVIDDSQFVMANEYMRRAKEVGYQKFTDIGQHFFSILDAIRKLPEDVCVFFLHHTEIDQWGNTKAKTIGKMLDSVITLESKFTIVLQTIVNNGKYGFMTHNSGTNTVKSPFEMFTEDVIPNDLKLVQETVEQYYTVF